MRPGHDSVRDTPDFAAGPSSFSSRSWKAHAQAQTQKRRSTVMGTARGVLPRRMTSGLFSYQAGAYACCGGVLTLIALLATGSLMWGPPPTSGTSRCSCCKAGWPVRIVPRLWGVSKCVCESNLGVCGVHGPLLTDRVMGTTGIPAAGSPREFRGGELLVHGWKVWACTTSQENPLPLPLSLSSCPVAEHSAASI